MQTEVSNFCSLSIHADLYKARRTCNAKESRQMQMTHKNWLWEWSFPELVRSHAGIHTFYSQDVPQVQERLQHPCLLANDGSWKY